MLRTVGLATGVLGVTAATSYVESSVSSSGASGLRQRLAPLGESWQRVYRGVVDPAQRVVRTLVVGAAVIGDYEWSLRNLERGSEEYRMVQQRVHERCAKRMLWLAHAQGGLFVKAGQHIASMNHVLPDAYTDTLSVLQDRAKARPFEEIVDVLQKEHGEDAVERLFKEFDTEPVASASLAQVHRAVTRDGMEVAVKLQYPHLAHQFESDMWSVRLLTRVAYWFNPALDLRWIHDSFYENMKRELDFEKEAKSSEIAASFLSRGDNAGEYYVPRIRWDLTTKRCLAMEYVHGVKINDVRAIRDELGLDPRACAKSLTDLFSRMIFQFGFIHCDPHPGNIFVRRRASGEHQLVILDHGLYRVVTEDFRLNHCRMWWSLLTRDAELLQDSTQKLGLERYTEWMPLVLTYRKMGGGTRLGERMSKQDRVKLYKQLRGFGFADWNDFIRAMPDDMYFVMRTSNLVRSINRDLGGTTRDRLRSMFQAAFVGLDSNDSYLQQRAQLSEDDRHTVVHVKRERLSWWRRLLTFVRTQWARLEFKVRFFVLEGAAAYYFWSLRFPFLKRDQAEEQEEQQQKRIEEIPEVHTVG